MAKIRPGDTAALAPVSRRLTPPGVFLLRMTIFLTLVGFLAAILFDQLKHSFLNNPGLNGLIVGTLVLGIIYAYRQGFIPKSAGSTRFASPTLDSRSVPSRCC